MSIRGTGARTYDDRRRLGAAELRRMGRGVSNTYRGVRKAYQVAPFAGLARGRFARGAKRLIKELIALGRKWRNVSEGKLTQVLASFPDPRLPTPDFRL